MLKDEAQNVNFTVNDHEYNQGYYIVDNIYPLCLVFMKTISTPIDSKVVSVHCVPGEQMEEHVHGICGA
jgi:hypothetical protein